jgi:hypothetical protein
LQWAADDLWAYEEMLDAAKRQEDPRRRERDLAAARRWYADQQAQSPLPEFRQPYPHLRNLWKGFWRHQGDRHTALGGMGGIIIGALPYASVSRWLRDHGYEQGSDRWESAEDLLYTLDAEYLRASHERLNEGSEPNRKDDESDDD